MMKMNASMTRYHDYNRFSWLFLLKHKSKVTNILKNFLHLVRLQFGVNIESSITNNTKDFYNNEIKAFFRNEKIRHEK